MSSEWIKVKDQLPPKKTVVLTKIDDGYGVPRNVQELKLENTLWFFPDGSMYVYYTPTHWKPIPIHQ